MKRLEHAIQNSPGMHEFVVTIRYEDGIYLPFCQVWVIRIAVNNVNVTLKML